MSTPETPTVPEPQPQTFFVPAAPPSNLPLGIAAGAIAAIAGAIVWAAIAYATDMVIGYIAIGVGFLVGLAMRRFGRGSSQVYGVAGAVLALCGCVLGDVFTLLAVGSKMMEVSIIEVYKTLPSDVIVDSILQQEPMGWVIYAIAVFAGYKYSITPAATPAEQPAAG